MQFRPEPEVSFHNIQEKAGLRHWLRNQFLAVMYGFDPNGGELDMVTQQALPGFYLASTSILGPIRLRQARVQANSCEVRLILVRGVRVAKFGTGAQNNNRQEQKLAVRGCRCWRSGRT